MIYTSNFGHVKTLPPQIVPVSIARGSPPWFRGASYSLLAPSRALLHQPRAVYDVAFAALLHDLDPAQVVQDLQGIGAEVALLCWERHNEAGCHRRLVAEWLEEHCAIDVPEWGFERHETLSYGETPWAVPAPKKPRVPRQGRLFP